MNSLSKNLNHIFTICFLYILSLFLLYPSWAPMLLDSALNQLDTDYLIFKHLHTNKEYFANSLMLPFIDIMVNKFGFMLFLSQSLTELGLLASEQHLLFYAVQILIGTVGSYFIINTFNVPKILLILIFIFFMFAYFSLFGRYIGGPGFMTKTTASCIGIAVGFVSIALFLNNKNTLSSILSALLIYIHPIYAVALLALNFSHSVHSYLIKKSPKEILFKMTFFSLICLVPFLMSAKDLSLFSADMVLDMRWWEYLKSKTSNPFPLQDGIGIVLPTLFVLCFVYRSLKTVNLQINFEVRERARWIIGFVIAAWLVQIFFTEIFPVTFVARLSLTRLSPFALIFIVIFYTLTVWRYRQFDKSGLWIFLLLAPALLYKNYLLYPETMRNLFGSFTLLFGGYWDDFAIYPDILIMMTCLLGFIKIAVNQKYISATEGILLKQSHIKWMHILSILILFSILLNNVGMLLNAWSLKLFLSSICCFYLMIWICERYSSVRIIEYFSIFLDGKKNGFLASVLILALIQPSLNAFKTIQNPPNKDFQTEKIWEFLDKKTQPNDMFVVIPFFNTRKYPIMPLRPIFLDWGEAQYPLYDPSMVSDTIHRLGLLGMDIERAIDAPRCHGLKQYVDGMCRRKLFESLSQDYPKNWRADVASMKSVAPNLKYAIIENKNVIDGDTVVLVTDTVSIIKLP